MAPALVHNITPRQGPSLGIALREGDDVDHVVIASVHSENLSQVASKALVRQGFAKGIGKGEALVYTLPTGAWPMTYVVVIRRRARRSPPCP